MFDHIGCFKVLLITTFKAKFYDIVRVLNSLAFINVCCSVVLKKE